MVLYIDSFDDRATAQLNSRAVYAETGSQIASGGVCGTQAYTNSTSGGGISFGIDNVSESPVAQVGLAYNHGNGASTCSPLFIGGPSGPNNVLAFIQATRSAAATPNALQVYTGINTILGTQHFSTAANFLPVTSTYVYLEYRVLFDDVNGEIDFWVNGVNLFSTTGIDTISGFSSGPPWVSAGVASTNGTGRLIDDFYAMNGDGVAPLNATVSLAAHGGTSAVHVVSLLPQTDAVSGGAIRDWTPVGTTDHGGAVDEVPPNGDTDYVETLDEGAEELFRFPLISVASDVVYAVQSGMVARKSGIGNAEALMIASEGGGAIADGPDRWGISAENYYAYMSMWDTPPDSAGWTIPVVGDTQWGMRHSRVRT